MSCGRPHQPQISHPAVGLLPQGFTQLLVVGLCSGSSVVGSAVLAAARLSPAGCASFQVAVANRVLALEEWATGNHGTQYGPPSQGPAARPTLRMDFRNINIPRTRNLSLPTLSK